MKKEGCVAGRNCLAMFHYSSIVHHLRYLAKNFTPFTSYDQCGSNVYNFIANGEETGEENVFDCWATFEPSKSAIFGKKHVTALGSASCCKKILIIYKHLKYIYKHNGNSKLFIIMLWKEKLWCHSSHKCVTCHHHYFKGIVQQCFQTQKMIERCWKCWLLAFHHQLILLNRRFFGNIPRSQPVKGQILFSVGNSCQMAWWFGFGR